MPTQVETRIIDGKAIAFQLKEEVGQEVSELIARGVQPGLAVVLVGDNPASQVYVRNKTRSSTDLGIHSEQVNLPSETQTPELLKQIGELNRADHIDGILVQLPLPSHIDADKILRSIIPAKDVDGFHPTNVGRLCIGKPFLAPCTPMGILEILRRESVPMGGQRVVIIGRSNIVGKPMALLLLQEHCTVTVCHSKSQGLAEICREADILISAVGKAGFVTGDFVKPRATVVDVGMNSIQTLEELEHLYNQDTARRESFNKKGYCLTGDVNPSQVIGIAGALTPVPGGVGPMTIAHLMKNTVLACRRRRINSKRSQA